ncbi:hypothetical protein P3G55_20445 [Leptospira sp. 96542]|nr:hypothetical protein [Leptospira sp. 96542]
MNFNYEKTKEECLKYALEYCKFAYEVIEDSKTTNKIYSKMDKLFKNLLKHSKGKEILELMIEEKSDYIKYISAVYVIHFDEKKALSVLKKLNEKYKKSTEGLGLMYLSIDMFLKEWEKGNIRT